MAKQLENKFFLYSNYLKPEYMLENVKRYKRECELKYKGNCIFRQNRNKNGVRIIVEEKQIEKEGEER